MASPQTTPRILHDGLKCIVAGRHVILDALVEPADDLVTVKAYFRAEIYPAFFYVEMTPTAGRFRAVLPRPMQDIQSVVYYLEAVDSAFNSLRTEEFRPRVAIEPEECADDGPPPAYLEGPASITVGQTTAGSNFPPGFLTDGIIATITTAGRVAGEGGAGTLLAVGAAGGAAAGVGILVAGGDDSATTTVVAGSPTSVPASTTTVAVTTVPPSAAPLKACFETEPNPPTIPVGATVRFDASCTTPERELIALYSWTFGDGRDGREGRVINRVYPEPGIFTAELTVTDLSGNQDRTSKDVRVEAAPAPGPGPGSGPTSTVPGTSDRAITGLSGPTSGVNVNTTATYNVTFINNGPDLDPTVTVIVSFNAANATSLSPIAIATAGCGTSSGGGSLVFTCFIGSLGSGAGGSRALSVQYRSADTYNISASISGGTSDPNPGNNGGNLATTVTLRSGLALETAFSSEIRSSAPGGVQATIELNSADTAATDDTAPARFRLKSRSGRNVLVGHALGSLDGALWRFDFETSEGFVPGSLFVEAGEVVALGSRSVVLRLSGSEAVVRLRFQLEP
jgi:hypothetical protein